MLLLVVTNLNSFTIPWIMTGGGPAGASHIWITAIYEMAFGRLRFGPAAAYSVILFVIMMSLGYFYVRALAGAGERSRRDEHAATDRRLARRRLGVPDAAAAVRRAADGLDAADVDQDAVRGAAVSAGMVAAQSDAARTTRALLSPTSDVGQEFLTYLLNSVWVSSATTVLGVIVAVPAAYAFSRFRFPGREMLFYAVLLRNMFPAWCS